MYQLGHFAIEMIGNSIQTDSLTVNKFAQLIWQSSYTFISRSNLSQVQCLQHPLFPFPSFISTFCVSSILQETHALRWKLTFSFSMIKYNKQKKRLLPVAPTQFLTSHHDYPGGRLLNGRTTLCNHSYRWVISRSYLCGNFVCSDIPGCSSYDLMALQVWSGPILWWSIPPVPAPSSFFGKKLDHSVFLILCIGLMVSFSISGEILSPLKILEDT